MSWKLVAKKNDPITKIGVAVFQKPKDNDAYNLREFDATPPFCASDDKIDAAWYVYRSAPAELVQMFQFSNLHDPLI